MSNDLLRGQLTSLAQYSTHCSAQLSSNHLMSGKETRSYREGGSLPLEDLKGFDGGLAGEGFHLNGRINWNRDDS